MGHFFYIFAGSTAYDILSINLEEFQLIIVPETSHSLFTFAVFAAAAETADRRLTLGQLIGHNILRSMRS